MERLTEWHGGHGSLVRGDGYTKLTRYEDTGLEPEEVQELIRRMKEICLCQIGDTVYVVGGRGTRGQCVAMTVIGIEIGKTWTLLKVACPGSDIISYLHTKELGKKFFLTQEDAVAKAGKQR